MLLAALITNLVFGGFFCYGMYISMYKQFWAKLYHVQPHEHNMLGHCEKTDGKIYNHSIMTGVIASQLKVSKGRPVSKCIFIILLGVEFHVFKMVDPRSYGLQIEKFIEF